MSHVLTVAPVALVTLAAVAPPRRPRPAASVGFWLGYLANEFPFLVLCWLVASTLLALGSETPGSPAGLAILALVVLTACGLALIMWRGLLAGPVLARALSRDLGLGGGTGSSVGRAEGRRLPVRTVLWPLPLGARSVQRIANVSYGPAGRRNRRRSLSPESCPSGRAGAVHFHRGHFRMGGKSRESRPLRLRTGLKATAGWASAPTIAFAGGPLPGVADRRQAGDRRKKLRPHAPQYGGTPSTAVVAGALRGCIRRFHCRVAVVDLVGFSRPSSMWTPRSAPPDCLTAYDGGPRAWRTHRRRRRAPAFAVMHHRSSSRMATTTRSFRRRALELRRRALRGVSISPVVYAELPGPEHCSRPGCIRFDSST